MMEPLFLVLVGITGLFFLFLIVKNVLKSKEMCVICASVSFMWIALLGAYFYEIFENEILIAILMGGSAVGLFYMLNEKLSVFKLPFVLTLFSVIYFVFEGIEINAVYFLLGLWVLFGLAYLFRENKNFNGFVNKIVECCRNW